ncbi:MAG: hypothetical protein PHU61_02950 [Candidatus Absconditabacteria bacterium]|nr:hypothetical protein [Candidatus Absconditabacteria bacterium]MDD3868261.1 hypothetical protein [Candidatus Absconditabacteria bacterium]MDD4714611.1 hypothetical protein [Candidatus Absconditabacteria bacterium]
MGEIVQFEFKSDFSTPVEDETSPESGENSVSKRQESLQASVNDDLLLSIMGNADIDLYEEADDGYDESYLTMGKNNYSLAV